MNDLIVELVDGRPQVEHKIRTSAGAFHLIGKRIHARGLRGASDAAHGRIVDDRRILEGGLEAEEESDIAPGRAIGVVEVAEVVEFRCALILTDGQRSRSREGHEREDHGRENREIHVVVCVEGDLGWLESQITVYVVEDS
jgi:hypothetical protein